MRSPPHQLHTGLHQSPSVFNQQFHLNFSAFHQKEATSYGNHPHMEPPVIPTMCDGCGRNAVLIILETFKNSEVQMIHRLNVGDATICVFFANFTSYHIFIFLCMHVRAWVRLCPHLITGGSDPHGDFVGVPKWLPSGRNFCITYIFIMTIKDILFYSSILHASCNQPHCDMLLLWATVLSASDSAFHPCNLTPHCSEICAKVCTTNHTSSS